jgi:hypothetical protein
MATKMGRQGGAGHVHFAAVARIAYITERQFLDKSRTHAPQQFNSHHFVGASKNARRDDRILITKFVPDRRFAGGSPGLVVSIFCPLLDR